MKKLSKKLNTLKETIEAYAYCGCNCGCDCTCSCGGSGTASMYLNNYQTSWHTYAVMQYDSVYILK